MRGLSAIYTFIAALALAVPAQAQDVVTELYGSPNSDANNATIRSDVVPLFQEGRLMGCTVTFQVLQRDNVYRRGDFALLDGSVGLLYSRGKAIAGTLKLGVGSMTTDGKVTRTAPAEAAVISERTSTSANEVFNSHETEPGFRFFILDLSKQKNSAFLGAMATAQTFNRIEGYYALRPGGLGSNFYVDMRVRSFSPSEPDSLQLNSNAGGILGKCIDDLFALATADGTP